MDQPLLCTLVSGGRKIYPTTRALTARITAIGTGPELLKGGFIAIREKAGVIALGHNVSDEPEREKINGYEE